MSVKSINIDVFSCEDKDKEDIKTPNCFICLDTGIIMYWKKAEQGEHEYVAHCICEEGGKYAYDGRICKDYKSNYYIPAIDEITDPETIAKENISDFYKRNNGNIEVINELKRIVGRR